MTNTVTGAGEALCAALVDAERVAKKQKSCAAATAAALESAVSTLEAAAAGLRGGCEAGRADASEKALRSAAAALRGSASAGAVAAHTKDLHGAVGKLGKVRSWFLMAGSVWGEGRPRHIAVGPPCAQTLSPPKPTTLAKHTHT
jgi:hypothetical protein